MLGDRRGTGEAVGCPEGRLSYGHALARAPARFEPATSDRFHDRRSPEVTGFFTTVEQVRRGTFDTECRSTAELQAHMLDPTGFEPATCSVFRRSIRCLHHRRGVSGERSSLNYPLPCHLATRRCSHRARIRTSRLRNRSNRTLHHRNLDAVHRAAGELSMSETRACARTAGAPPDWATGRRRPGGIRTRGLRLPK